MTEVRSSNENVKTLSFVAESRRLESPALSHQPQSSGSTSKSSSLVSSEAGVVEEVLPQTVDGYETHAYLVRWNERIVGVSGAAGPARQVGDTMSFRLSRVPFPAPMEGGALRQH